MRTSSTPSARDCGGGDDLDQGITQPVVQGGEIVLESRQVLAGEVAPDVGPCRRIQSIAVDYQIAGKGDATHMGKGFLAIGRCLKCAWRRAFFRFDRLLQRSRHALGRPVHHTGQGRGRQRCGATGHLTMAGDQEQQPGGHPSPVPFHTFHTHNFSTSSGTAIRQPGAQHNVGARETLLPQGLVTPVVRDRGATAVHELFTEGRRRISWTRRRGRQSIGIEVVRQPGQLPTRRERRLEIETGDQIARWRKPAGSPAGLSRVT